MEKKQSLLPLIIIVIAFVLATFLVICSCQTPKTIYNDRIVETHDTITVYDSVKVISTPLSVTVPVPASSQERVTKDTCSILSTPLYKSIAYWDGLFLHHTLESMPNANIKSTINAPIIIKNHKETSAKHAFNNKNTTKIIEKPLTIFQKIKLNTWWLLLLFSIPTFCILFRWIARKILHNNKL